jgi:hypothetical protein
MPENKINRLCLEKCPEPLRDFSVEQINRLRDACDALFDVQAACEGGMALLLDGVPLELYRIRIANGIVENQFRRGFVNPKNVPLTVPT